MGVTSTRKACIGEQPSPTQRPISAAPHEYHYTTDRSFCKGQQRINVLSVKDNLFNKITFNDYNKFISAEKDVMEEVAIERGLLTQADEDARNVVEAFLKTIPGMDTYTLKFN